MKEPLVTLDQWYIFKVVVEQGSFQAAADYLIKSQSTISYAIQKMQENLGVRLFEQKGRRAVVTEIGRQMLQRADELLAQAQTIERLADDYSAGWEPLLKIMVSSQILPAHILPLTTKAFAEQCNVTSIEFQSGTLSGVTDAAVHGTADLVISNVIPPGFQGEKLCYIELSRFVHHMHPLAKMTETLDEAELKKHAQIVVSDSSKYRRIDIGWLGSAQRWTVDSFHESMNLMLNGLGHGTLPVQFAAENVEKGLLTELVVEGQSRTGCQLYLIYTNRKALGLAGNLFSTLLKKQLAVK